MCDILINELVLLTMFVLLLDPLHSLLQSRKPNNTAIFGYAFIR